MCHHLLNEKTISDADLPLLAIPIESSPQPSQTRD
jgi:hypothetical protein